MSTGQSNAYVPDWPTYKNGTEKPLARMTKLEQVQAAWHVHARNGYRPTDEQCAAIMKANGVKG